MKKFLARLADSTTYVITTALIACISLMVSVFSVSLLMLNICLCVFLVSFVLSLLPMLAD